MAIFRLLLLNHLSEAWFPAFVKRLFNFFALSVFEAIVLRPTVMVCKPTIGLIPFRERTTFQNFDTSAVIRELEEYTPFTCLVFRSLIHELGVKSQVTKICNECCVFSWADCCGGRGLFKQQENMATEKYTWCNGRDAPRRCSDVLP